MGVEKEDGQSEQCICQLKSTDKQSISIKQNDIHILEQNAAIAHKLPVFALQFLNTGEVWVMIKPEDLTLIQSLVEGDDISEQLQSGFDLGIDNEDDTCYNMIVSGKNAGKSYLARQAYMKQREKERTEQEQEYKQRMKEKNRERRKQRKEKNRERRKQRKEKTGWKRSLNRKALQHLKDCQLERTKQYK